MIIFGTRALTIQFFSVNNIWWNFKFLGKYFFGVKFKWVLPMIIYIINIPTQAPKVQYSCIYNNERSHKTHGCPRLGKSKYTCQCIECITSHKQCHAIKTNKEKIQTNIDLKLVIS